MKTFFTKIAGLAELRMETVGSGGLTIADDCNTSNDAVFDPTYLSEVASALTPGRFAALMNSYREHTKEQLARIETLLTSNDITQIAAEAHALVGSAGSFGALQVSLLARALEQASKRQQFEAIPGLVADLRKASDLASVAMSDWWKARSA